MYADAYPTAISEDSLRAAAATAAGLPCGQPWCSAEARAEEGARRVLCPCLTGGASCCCDDGAALRSSVLAEIAGRLPAWAVRQSPRRSVHAAIAGGVR